MASVRMQRQMRAQSNPQRLKMTQQVRVRVHRGRLHQQSTFVILSQGDPCLVTLHALAAFASGMAGRGIMDSLQQVSIQRRCTYSMIFWRQEHKSKQSIQAKLLELFRLIRSKGQLFDSRRVRYGISMTQQRRVKFATESRKSSMLVNILSITVSSSRTTKILHQRLTPLSGGYRSLKMRGGQSRRCQMIQMSNSIRRVSHALSNGRHRMNAHCTLHIHIYGMTSLLRRV